MNQQLPRSRTLALEQDGPWLTVWFDDPANGNALGRTRIAELARLTHGLALRPDIRGVLFRGRGGVFCEGALGDVLRAGANRDIDREALVQASRSFGALLRRVATLPQLTVMAVEGPAHAAGCGFAAAGDLVLAAEGAEFAFTDTRRGMVPAQIAPIMLARLGHRAARRLLLLGEHVDARAALDIGLADAVFPDSAALDAEIARIRDGLTLCAPGAVAATKRLLLDLPGLLPDEQLDMAADVFADQIESAEGREGLESFFGARSPGWTSPGGGRGTPRGS
ncbi:enoyl-CoA hydratase-related protein [Rhodosalinus sp. 5P4]|uniref:enoyl-CoA hydratase-related protein n=1 Tax=Rhodosalinus sp. 5P4 TaxID=3239196 RepID=UPI003525FB17